MASREKYPKLSLRGDNYEIAKNGREPGDKLIEVSFVNIDYKCFKKSPAEKAQLKAAKAQAKYDEMKRR